MDVNQFRDKINKIKTKIDTLSDKEVKEILDNLVNLIDALYQKILCNKQMCKKRLTH